MSNAKNLSKLTALVSHISNLIGLSNNKTNIDAVATGGGSVLTSSAIGTTVQAYDSNTVKKSDLAGSVVQNVVSTTGALATGTTLIPIDDTIPQITEGFQVLSASITPKASTSQLLIQLDIQAASTVGTYVSFAVFRDSGVNAIAAKTVWITASNLSALSMLFKVPASSTATSTFTVRVGPGSAGTVTINGNSAGTRFFGGAGTSSISISEIAA